FRHSDGARRREAKHARRAGGDLRPGAGRAAVRRPRRGRRARERHAVRSRVQHLVERHHGGASPDPADPGGHDLGERAQSDRREHALRRLQAIRNRSRARPRRDRDVHGAEVRVHVRLSLPVEENHLSSPRDTLRAALAVPGAERTGRARADRAANRAPERAGNGHGMAGLAGKGAALLRPAPKAKEQEVLDVATEYFLKHGYQGASINEMARQSGISKESIYRYFSSKKQ